MSDEASWQRINPVVIEERLTRMEERQTAGFLGVNNRLDTLNGQVATNTRWKNAHDAHHGASDAYRQGRDAAWASIRKRDAFALTLLLGAVGAAVEFIGRLIG